VSDEIYKYLFAAVPAIAGYWFFKAFIFGIRDMFSGRWREWRDKHGEKVDRAEMFFGSVGCLLVGSLSFAAVWYVLTQ